MSAYFFFDVRKIHDQDKLDKYKPGAFATVEQYGGHYLVIGGPCEVVEGDWSPTIPVIVAFPNREQAQAWYGSDAYRALKAQRLEATDSCGVLIDGLNGKPGGA